MFLDVPLDIVLEIYSQLEDRTSSIRDSSMGKEPNISKKWSKISLKSKWPRCVNCWSIACKECDENCPGEKLKVSRRRGCFCARVIQKKKKSPVDACRR